jgi:hypothetical protein
MVHLDDTMQLRALTDVVLLKPRQSIGAEPIRRIIIDVLVAIVANFALSEQL